MLMLLVLAATAVKDCGKGARACRSQSDIHNAAADTIASVTPSHTACVHAICSRSLASELAALVTEPADATHVLCCAVLCCDAAVRLASEAKKPSSSRRLPSACMGYCWASVVLGLGPWCCQALTIVLWYDPVCTYA